MSDFYQPSDSGWVVRALKSRFGPVLARPWLDRVLLWGLEYLFFPLSRLWAAARAAQGSVDAYIEAAPMKPPARWRRRRIAAALRNFERKRIRAFSTEHLWNWYMFGHEEVSGSRLQIVEEMRLDHRTAYNLARRSFAPLIPLVRSSVHMAPPTPSEVEDRYGPGGERLGKRFALPDEFPAVERSRPLKAAWGRDYWLRFPSPSSHMADLAYARVHEPEGVEAPPTLIFGHGICVEFDHYRQILDEVAMLTRLGIRVIRPEAPWHGRRVLPGHYGGEQLLSALPVSMIEFLAAQHLEWATLVDWCVQQGSRSVAIGGSSLGAQTAKAIAVRARDWPESLRPTALLCVTHSTRIAEAALDGALSDIWNLGGAMRAAGWTSDLERAWLDRLDPDGVPCMPPERIVSVTGRRDTITPEASALDHMERWNVPRDNVFSFDRGHFTVPLGLFSDNRPLRRFADILLGCDLGVPGPAQDPS